MKATIKNLSYILLLITAPMLAKSFAQETEPYFTTIEKLHAVKTDMTIDQVNQTLGILPYEAYFDVNEKSKILVYKYKHKMQVLPSIRVTDESYLTEGGDAYYSAPGNIYIIFNSEDKMSSYFTDAGKKESTNILKFDNTIRLIIDDPAKYENYSIETPAKKKNKAGK